MAFVSHLIEKARARLVCVDEDAAITDAAGFLRAGTDIIVVCNAAGRLVGIITKTDLVEQLAKRQWSDQSRQVNSVMRRKVVSCNRDDELQAVWSLMHVHDLKNLPVIDPEGRPEGIVNARDALEMLLHETEDAETLLRDYVMGIGYR
jgi:CBS-domain-containing membrane protein